jgi:spore coat polysaccharide biosynthesis protein SpsF
MLVRRLYGELGLAEHPRPFPEILAHVRAHPELAAINAHVEQKRA